MTEQIYIELLDEGLSVWRPATGLKVGDHAYVLLRPDGFDDLEETWRFPPGSVVEVERRQLADGPVLAACRNVTLDRVSA